MHDIRYELRILEAKIRVRNHIIGIMQGSHRSERRLRQRDENKTKFKDYVPPLGHHLYQDGVSTHRVYKPS